jgi:hypothetical protein
MPKRYVAHDAPGSPGLLLLLLGHLVSMLPAHVPGCPVAAPPIDCWLTILLSLVWLLSLAWLQKPATLPIQPRFCR